MSCTMKSSFSSLTYVIGRGPRLRPLQFTSRRNCKSDCGKGFFLGLHYPISGSNMLCGERGKTRPPATKSREHVENCFFNYYFCTNCSKGEKYEKIKHVISLEFPFLDIYQKSRHPLFGSWSLLFVHVWFPNSEDPICFSFMQFFYI